MDQKPIYRKFVETIKKEEFISFYLSCNPEVWFSKKELLRFKFPLNARSLAGRYLIKKTICNYIKEHEKIFEIEILNNDLGKPEVLLSKNIHKSFELAGVKNIYCSISHSRNIIAGMTIFCF